MTVDAQDQMLLYIDDESGTGKSQIIKTVNLGYELLQQKSEVLLLASTDAAAYNIAGHTIHTALCLDFHANPRSKINSHTYLLWKEKSIMIIDEISMVSLMMLNFINQQCNKIWAVQQDSTAILDALSIMLFMKNFHQFPPINAQSL